MTARLPIPGQDKGAWGDILNDYLLAAHKPDGTLKASTVSSSSLTDNVITQSKLSAPTPAAGQVLGSDGTNLVWTTVTGSGSVADASISTKGIIQLAGDLGGTSALPTVPGLAAKADNTTVVHLAGSETISGSKNFTGGLQSAGTAVVVTGDSRLSDTRTPTDSTVTTAKLVASAVTQPKIATTNNPTATQVLTWNGSAMSWSTPAAGGSGSSSTAPINQTVYSAEPPVGLTAIAADGTTDDSATIRAHLAYVKSTYGGGRVVLPAAKTIKCSSGITIPAGVALVGSVTTVLNFSSAGNATAITINDANFIPLIGMSLIGNNTGDGSTFSSTTSIGISITGNGLSFRDININRFNKAIDLAHDNTFIVDFYNCSIGNCALCINIDLTGVNNSGERIVFNACTIYNSGTIFRAYGSGVGLFMQGCSLDYSQVYGNIGDAHVFLSNCHLESKKVNSSTTDWGTLNDYIIYMTGTGRLYMDNCNLIFSGAVYHVICATQGPYTFGNGMAHFSNCTSYNTPTSGPAQQGFSEGLYAANSGDTTKTVYSMFMSKWNSVSTLMVATDTYPQSPIGLYISALDAVAGSVTITFNAPIATSPTWVSVDY